MKALLLNSGLGSRMGALTKNLPKCMCQIGYGHTIISWQLEMLRRNGVREAVVTTGPFADLLEEHILTHGSEIEFIFVNNPVYSETNYIYSMYLAKDYLNDDILLLHGDLVIDPDVITDLVSEKRSIVTVDSLVPLPEKDFKAKLKNGRIEAVGIEFFGKESVACQPAYKFLYMDFQKWMEEIANFCSRGETKVYAENALNNISDKIALYPLELNNRLCNEVDNINDLKWVSNIFKKHYDKWRL